MYITDSPILKEEVSEDASPESIETLGALFVQRKQQLVDKLSKTKELPASESNIIEGVVSEHKD